MGLLDGPAAGPEVWGPAAASVAAARPGVERAAGRARDRDLVTLVAMSVQPCVEIGLLALERPGSTKTGEY